MAVNSKAIKTRIRSIKNTKKVTKAMELVAAAKMRKAVEFALGTRDYAKLAWDIALRLSNSTSLEPSDELARFFAKSEKEEKILLLSFASNRGLCGGFNSGITKAVLNFVKEKGGENVEVITIGKKLVSTLSTYGVKPKMAYDKDDGAKTVASIANIASFAYDQFKTSEVDAVHIAYTDYQSSLVQTPVVKQLFPFIAEASITSTIEKGDAQTKGDSRDYLHEPSQAEVLSYLVPRLGELQVFQALLESNASEHSARMVAMKGATDAAGEMLEDLTLQFNRARQSAITQEIAEISAGMAAVT